MKNKKKEKQNYKWKIKKIRKIKNGNIYNVM